MADHGLIGNPLGHSFSPQLHRALGGYDYALWPLTEPQLEPFLIKREFSAVNVTIPYKKAVIPYCAALTEEARQIGSVNCLRKEPDGTLLGHNTDLYGLLYLARRAGVQLKGKKVAILGSGGTSLTAQAAARKEGAREVLVVSRRGELTYERLLKEHRDTEVLINTTPVGMFPHEGAYAVDPSLFPHLEGALDAVYNPLRTAFIQKVEDMGLPCSGGFPMLAAPAWAAARFFTGADIPEEKLEKALKELELSLTNLILCGMPGSGKSSLGALCAQQLGRTFVDLDTEIEKAAGCSIPEIFQKEGEEGFRRRETEALRHFSREKGLVLATGGGTVLREENQGLLRQNGLCVWVRRPLENLPTEGRPLSQGGLAKLQAMYQAREPLYRKVSQAILENTGTLQEGAEKLREVFYETAHHQRP